MKAFQIMNVEYTVIKVDKDYRADVGAMEKAITPNTILLIGSAPSYPFGVMDPITDIAALALKKKLLFHVDACIGGFLLPFVKELGYPIPDFDFAVDGVTFR
jgi:glutamate/tyrosine decarboxylase-like PLP-dependent enzyme